MTEDAARTAVIIPVRNRPGLIVSSIESLQRQTLPVDEIVVVDDASTDETCDIIERLQQQDPRIRLCALKTQLGASHARNVGIDATTAEWVAFLDSDDQWLPDKHELQRRQLAKTTGAIAAFTGIRYMSPQGDKDMPLPSTLGPDGLRRINVLGSSSTALVKREALVAVGGFDEALPSCQDWDLWLRLERQGGFALVEAPLVLYDQTDGGRISKNLERVVKGHEIVFQRALEGTQPKARRAIQAWHQLRLAQIHLWDFGDARGALAACLRSLAIKPSRYGVQFLGWTLRSWWTPKT